MTGLYEPLLRLDRRATLAVRRLHAPGRDRFVKRVSFLGSQRFMIPATIAAAAALLAAGQGRLAAFFGGAVLGGRALSPLLKWTFRRRRPDLWPALETEKSHSFPSTHSTMGAVFFGGVGALVFRLAPQPAARGAGLVLCAIAVAAIAFSRVYLGAHWLSDVVGGVGLGLCWLLLWMFAFQAAIPLSPRARAHCPPDEDFQAASAATPRRRSEPASHSVVSDEVPVGPAGHFREIFPKSAEAGVRVSCSRGLRRGGSGRCRARIARSSSAESPFRRAARCGEGAAARQRH